VSPALDQILKLLRNFEQLNQLFPKVIIFFLCLMKIIVSLDYEVLKITEE